jgi:hypothetical protein
MRVGREQHLWRMTHDLGHLDGVASFREEQAGAGMPKVFRARAFVAALACLGRRLNAETHLDARGLPDPPTPVSEGRVGPRSAVVTRKEQAARDTAQILRERREQRNKTVLVCLGVAYAVEFERTGARNTLAPDVPPVACLRDCSAAGERHRSRGAPRRRGSRRRRSTAFLSRDRRRPGGMLGRF